MVSKESTWMWKCVFKMYMALQVGDVEQAWYLRSGRYLTPPYLLIINSY